MKINPQPEMGSLSVLNTGAGDIKLTFNQYDDTERSKALAMLQDMQRRGYAILVRLPDDTYARAQDIDTVTGSYVISLPADYPPIEGEIQPQQKQLASVGLPAYILPPGDLLPTDGSDQIKGGPDLPGIPPIMAEAGGLPPEGTIPPAAPEEPKRRGRPPTTTRKLPIEKTHATGVARSAGG